MALTTIPDFSVEVAKLPGLHHVAQELFNDVAAQHVKSLGLTLKLGTLADAVEAQRQQDPKTWPIHAPMIDPNQGSINEEESFAIIGLDASGIPRCSQSARLYSTGDGSLADLIISHRFYYGEKFHGEPPPAGYQTAELIGEALEQASSIKGAVLYSGGTRVDPLYERKGLSLLLIRLVHAVGEARWHPNWIIGQTKVEMSQKVLELCGYERAYPGFNTYKPALDTWIKWSLVSKVREDHYRDVANYVKAAKTRNSTV